MRVRRGRCGFVGLCHRAASFTYFGEVLCCPHKRIVTITKVYIARNNIHVELIRFLKNSDFNDIGNFIDIGNSEVGIRHLANYRITNIGYANTNIPVSMGLQFIQQSWSGSPKLAMNIPFILRSYTSKYQ